MHVNTHTDTDTDTNKHRHRHKQIERVRDTDPLNFHSLTRKRWEGGGEAVSDEVCRLSGGGGKG